MPIGGGTEDITAREITGLQNDIKELKRGQDTMSAKISDVLVQLARQDERERQTSQKLDQMSVAITNTYATNSDHSELTKRVTTLENWLTWILRLMVGALAASAFAAMKLHITM